MKDNNMQNNNNNVEVHEQKKNGFSSMEEALINERTIAPFVDVYETKEEFFLTANLPGVPRENLQVKIEDGSLIIFGKVNFNEILERKYLLNETEIGNYYRHFKISDSIDESKISAKLENGQLIVTLPKHERVKPKTIQIK
jgi:HSP20 family protein